MTQQQDTLIPVPMSLVNATYALLQDMPRGRVNQLCVAWETHLQSLQNTKQVEAPSDMPDVPSTGG